MGLDAGSDLYSAGVGVFEWVTGRVAFEGDTREPLNTKQLGEEPPDPRRFNAEVPESRARVIRKAMVKEPAARFQAAAEMHDALEAIG